MSEITIKTKFDVGDKVKTPDGVDGKIGGIIIEIAHKIFISYKVDVNWSNGYVTKLIQEDDLKKGR